MLLRDPAPFTPTLNAVRAINRLIALALCGGVICPPAAAHVTQRDRPALQFGAYPAGAAYTGRHRLILRPADRAFRTRLREAARQPPDFAGHYVMALWGCGTECVMGAAVDLRSGRVTWLPGSLCCWYAGHPMGQTIEPLRYRLDSRMIVLNGMRNERMGDLGRHYYRIENGRFVHIVDEPR